MNTYKHITSSDQYINLVEKKSGIFYFSHLSCNVGESMKDKVLVLATKTFPKLDCYFVDVELLPDLAGQNSIFAYPTILVFFEGKEYYRFSRNISISDMRDKISRPYEMLFADS